MDFISVLIRKMFKDRVSDISAECAYYLILSFCPFMIFLLSLIGIFAIPEGKILTLLKDFLPLSIGEFIDKSFIYLTNAKSTKILSISLILSLFLASNGVRIIIIALNTAYGNTFDVGFIKINFKAIIMTLLTSVMIILLISLSLISSYLKIDSIQGIGHSGTIMVSKGIFTVILIFTLFILLYRFLPTIKLKIRNILWGSLFSSASFIIGLNVFDYYATYFSKYKIYGEIGVFTMFLLWLYFSANIIIIGGEINSIVNDMYDQKKIEKATKKQ